MYNALINMQNMWNLLNDIFGNTVVHPQYFVKRGERKTISFIVKYAHGTVLDIGCGRQWYRSLIESKVEKYFALDHPIVSKKYKSPFSVEIYSDAAKIPLTDRSVDIPFMVMVLEHLPNPDKTMAEIKRILSKKGKGIICTVENYPGHDFPYNYYHFTSFGLKELIKRHGLQIESHVGFGNFWETRVVYQNVYIMQKVKKLVSTNSTMPFGILLLLVAAPLMICSNVLAFAFGGVRYDPTYALGHIIIIRHQRKD